MRQSRLFPGTQKNAPKDAESVNHRLLVRAGFIDQLMSGSWSLLPLGWRVVEKINDIVREELDKIGCQEVLMPLLHPKNIWNETGRWDKADEVMYKLKDAKNRDYALSFTHEEIFLDLVRKHLKSYQNLPVALYHFSTKFRQEPRAKSGILRGREFLMKDLYSIHADAHDFEKFYQSVKEAYGKIFERIGLDFRVTEAPGGVFTSNFTHEFQVMAETGEDTIFYCKNCAWGANAELGEYQEGGKCPDCGGVISKSNSIEVGNIFPFGTHYSEKMNVYYTDKDGKRKPVYFGSYGIGTTRVMGTVVEVSHDSHGILWPESVAPFGYHLIELPGGRRAEEIYRRMQEVGLEVLFDDRKVSAGEKFSDSDLIGIPTRLVVSEKTGDALELKKRRSGEMGTVKLEDLLK